MRLVNGFVLGMAFLFFHPAHADWFTREVGDGVIQVARFKRANDGWQDRVQEWSFKSEREVRAFLNAADSTSKSCPC